MKMPLTTISLAMASYGDGYLHDSAMMKFASSMYSGSKYIMDPESRAKQVMYGIAYEGLVILLVHVQLFNKMLNCYHLTV